MMKRFLGGILVGLVVLALSLCMAWAIMDTGQKHALKNPYWPFTVETVVSDR